MSTSAFAGATGGSVAGTLTLTVFSVVLDILLRAPHTSRTTRVEGGVSGRGVTCDRAEDARAGKTPARGACERATMAAAVRESKAFPAACVKGTFVRVWARKLEERKRNDLELFWRRRVPIMWGGWLFWRTMSVRRCFQLVRRCASVRYKIEAGGPWGLCSYALVLEAGWL